ncbi:SDR family oxidoreductase [Streptomyces sp. NPDC006334]|uniref:SDR family oxidoreductase n=1 Tax=Streptomyces sp. NPDC006334 TaxID=3156754 RepID=UPI0033A81599
MITHAESGGHGTPSHTSARPRPRSAAPPDYAASKAAVVAFTKSVASHLAERGVRANMVSPGPTWTVLNVAGQRFPDDYLTHLGGSSPMGRVAQPEEVAPAYVYLASDADSSFTVGEIIAVTGGLADTR